LSRPAALLIEKGKPSPIEEAARKDSAVHVSLSSDSLVKQPGDHGDPPPRYAGEPPKLKTSDRNRTTIHTIGEELRRRAIAPKGGRRAVVAVYRGERATLSTADLGKILGKLALWIATPGAVPRGPPRALRAALAPHSSRVVCTGERPMVAARIK